jgi:hypothetical protein
MVEEVERLQGQVGALRREVWFTRRRDIRGIELSPNTATPTPTTSTGGGGMAGGQHHPTELLPIRRLSGTHLLFEGCRLT